MGVRGVYDENLKQPTTHILQTKDKFNNLFDDIKTTTTKIEYEILQINEENAEKKALKNLYKDKYDKLLFKYNKLNERNENIIGNLKTKFSN